MKNNLIKIFIFFLLLISFSTFGKTSITKKSFPFEQRDLRFQNVIICTGQYAYAYHSRNNCPGLNNCQAQLYTVSQIDAVNKYSRKACCRCWSNVVNNCHDDNPYNIGKGSSSNSDAGIGYAALAIVATGAILLSNEVYAAPTHSFKKPFTFKTGYSSGGVESFEDLSNFGWTFQFRKNFTNSGLEYGAGFINYKYRVKSTFQSYDTEQKIWRVNINYVSNIFYSSLPERLNIFLGPSLNYGITKKQIGFGGIAGSSYQLSDRLKADIRYELTSATHQVYIGLQFLYQKKYFWKK